MLLNDYAFIELFHLHKSKLVLCSIVSSKVFTWEFREVFLSNSNSCGKSTNEVEVSHLTYLALMLQAIK